MFSCDGQAINAWCHKQLALKDALNIFLKKSAAVGVMVYTSLSPFRNISQMTSVARKRFVVLLYIDVANLSIIGIDSFIHSLVGNQLYFVKVSVTSTKLFQVFQRFCFLQPEIAWIFLALAVSAPIFLV